MQRQIGDVYMAKLKRRGLITAAVSLTPTRREVALLRRAKHAAVRQCSSR